MTVIVQLDTTKTPAVVVNTFDYGTGPAPASMIPPQYVDVTGLNPIPLPGYTYDGTSFAPGAVQQQQANAAALTAKAQSALTTNANYLAIASPTAGQVAAQVHALTLEANGIIRLLIGQLDSTANT